MLTNHIFVLLRRSQKTKVFVNSFLYIRRSQKQKYYVIPSDRGDKEGDPAHHDEHGAGEVDGEDEGAEWPGQADLKPVHAVVAWRYELSDMSN